MVDIEDLRPESNGPTMADVSRARRILLQEDVLWAVAIVRQAIKAEEAQSKIPQIPKGES